MMTPTTTASTVKPTAHGPEAQTASRVKNATTTMIARTPEPPYYAVIFTSLRNHSQDQASSSDRDDYADTARRMVALAHEQPGFLGVESARDEIGITVSYWSDLESIKQWKAHSEHCQAQENGKEKWYSAYKTRISLVQRDYSLHDDDDDD